MVNLSSYYLKTVALILLFSQLFSCSQEQHSYFRRSNSEVVPTAELSQRLVRGSFNHYQGSSAHQLVLQEAFDIEPYSALVNRELGVAYLKRGIASEFPRYYGRAADLDPLTWIGWRGYLYLYFYRDYARAIDDFNATDTLTPQIVDHPQSLSVDYMRAIAFQQLGDFEHARHFFDLHLEYEASHGGGERYTGSVAFLASAINYQSLGSNEQALAQLDKALTWGSKMADLHYYRASILHELGRDREARIALQKARDGYAADWYHERSYVEEFYQVYPEDFDELASKLGS